MEVLVTGGAGFIGSHIAERLLEKGHSVTVIDNLDPYYDVGIKERNVQRCEAVDEGRFRFVDANISDEAVARLTSSR